MRVGTGVIVEVGHDLPRRRLKPRVPRAAQPPVLGADHAKAVLTVVQAACSEQLSNATVQIDYLTGLFVALLKGGDFYRAGLEKDREKELESVERGR